MGVHYLRVVQTLRRLIHACSGPVRGASMAEREADVSQRLCNCAACAAARIIFCRSPCRGHCCKTVVGPAMPWSRYATNHELQHKRSCTETITASRQLPLTFVEINLGLLFLQGQLRVTDKFPWGLRKMMCLLCADPCLCHVIFQG